MSAYSDWRCGALSDDEYKTAYAMERGEDHGEIPFYDEDEDEERTYTKLKDGRYIIEIYLNENLETAKVELIDDEEFDKIDYLAFEIEPEGEYQLKMSAKHNDLYIDIYEYSTFGR